MQWPEEALEKVGNHFLSESGTFEDDVRAKILDIFVNSHLTSNKLA
jgi:hypothetical protein